MTGKRYLTLLKEWKCCSRIPWSPDFEVSPPRHHPLRNAPSHTVVAGSLLVEYSICVPCGMWHQGIITQGKPSLVTCVGPKRVS